MIIKRDESYLSLLMVSKSELFYSYFLIFFSGYLFIYLFIYLLICLCIYFAIFCILCLGLVLFGFVLTETYFLDEESSAGLVTCSQGDGLGLFMFKKKSKQVTEG